MSGWEEEIVLPLRLQNLENTCPIVQVNITQIKMLNRSTPSFKQHRQHPSRVEKLTISEAKVAQFR